MFTKSHEVPMQIIENCLSRASNYKRPLSLLRDLTLAPVTGADPQSTVKVACFYDETFEI